MSKKIIALFLAAATLFSLCACGGKLHNFSFSDNKPEEETKTDIETPLTGIELWSFDIGSDGDVSEFLEKFAESGADYVNFNVLWSSFEVEKGKYNWTFVDKVCNSIKNAGFKIGLSFVVWTNGLSFKEDVETQKLSDGTSYAYDDRRKDFPSLASDENLELLYDAVSALAVHFAERYEDETVVFKVITSPFGDCGYTADEDVDYSESAISKFVTYLSEKYETAENFCEKYSFSISDFSELKETDKEKLANTCLYDWKTFKQKTLSDFHAEAVKIFNAALPSCRTEIFFGGVEDTKTAVFRGFYDPYTVSRTVGATVYSTSWESAVPTDFFVSYLSDTTGGKVGLTVYESDLTDENRKTLAEELKNCNNVAQITFSFSGATEENISLIKEVSEALKNQSGSAENAVGNAYFINTADVIMRTPAINLYGSLKTAYEENGGSLRFITDTEIEDSEDLGGISGLITSFSGKNAYFTEKTAEKLIEFGIPIYADGTPSIKNEYGLSSDKTSELAELINKSEE